MLNFVRERPIQIVIQKTLSQRRGFLFHVSAGFTGPVDQLSGMVVNLVVVDQWLSELKEKLEIQIHETDQESLNFIFTQLLRDSVRLLQVRAKEAHVALSFVDFREERQFGFSWNRSSIASDAEGCIDFYKSHHLELLPNLSEASLLRVAFYWQHPVGSDADYGHEGFLILKALAQQTAPGFVRKLSEFKGHRLPGGGVLRKIVIHSLFEGSVLEI